MKPFNHNDYEEQRRHYQKRRDSIIKMWEDGLAVRKIANMYNVTTQNIYRILTEEKQRRKKAEAESQS